VLTAAVVVGAGSGTRFGAPKQFELLAGRPVLEWSVRAARTVADWVIAVVPNTHLTYTVDGADVIVGGGASRSASVRAGLAAVAEEAEVVVVHDAARPLAPPELFRAVIRAVAEGADAAVPAVAVADTIKEVNGGIVSRTVPRDHLVAVQTPQAFRRSVLAQAHAGNPEATDDAALVEQIGGQVVCIPGSRVNLKLTTREDLLVASAIVEAGVAELSWI
jgi:2-C-methyl-D-erythritol 4-phosphate cytidylyltransferase